VIPISKLAINSNISNSNLVSWMQKKVSDLGYSPANTDDVEVAIDEAINEMNEMVKDRGFGAIGPLMGVVMKKLGGTADGKLVNKLLKSKIEDLIE
ncbi:MAG: Glu-tRNA(Gln) amidotransferase GatDE subunit E, partial [Euryarchaeota archaeon]|nr:Glu-tRNA(Gln) amidotransferase GatDE subunit E [Euryarchaeota archaeon]